MKADIISVGDKVDLKAAIRPMAEKRNKNRVRIYKSRVLDILQDGKLKLSMPIEGGKVLLLPVDGTFEIVFYTEKGMFRCISKITDRYKEGNIYLLVVEILTQLEKVQRREYFRLLCTIETKYHELSENEIDIESKQTIVKYQKHIKTSGVEEEQEIEYKRGVIVDISGGGVRIVSEEKFKKGTYIKFKFQIRKNYTVLEFELAGLVLMSEELINRPGQYEHRVQYYNIKKEDRETIVKYIFDEERKIRKMK